jgi:Protein of unknown function (DUF4031)
MIYYCDNKRHLVCKPYSIENLHQMAKELNLKKCWFHHDHYDIPKKRIKEIQIKCRIISVREIYNIIHEKIEFTVLTKEQVESDRIKNYPYLI